MKTHERRHFVYMENDDGDADDDNDEDDDDDRT